MADETVSRSSSAKRFGFSKDKEGKSKGGSPSSKRSVKNLWGMRKSMKNKAAGSDDVSDVAKPAENSPPKVDGTSEESTADKALPSVSQQEEEVKLDEVKEVIKEEVKADFPNKKDDEKPSHEEQNPESTPNDPLSESQGADGKDLMASAMDELQSILHKKSDEEAKKEEQDKLEKSLNENTPLDEIKAPSLFERAKEEVEAVADAIRHKMEDEDGDKKQQLSDDKAKTNDHEGAAFLQGNKDLREEGCEVTLAKGLQKICAPWGNDKDDKDDKAD